MAVESERGFGSMSLKHISEILVLLDIADWWTFIFVVAEKSLRNGIIRTGNMQIQKHFLN